MAGVPKPCVMSEKFVRFLWTELSNNWFDRFVVSFTVATNVDEDEDFFVIIFSLLLLLKQWAPDCC